jgi:putative FmdB family regulatory protein
MPTYDYKCTACSNQFEQFQSMKDKPLRKCPKCGKNALERLIGTGAAVIFKGSGFYQTDYRSEAYKKSAEADKKPAATEAKTDGKAGDAGAKPAESKPAEKAEPAKVESKPKKPAKKK